MVLSSEIINRLESIVGSKGFSREEYEVTRDYIKDYIINIFGEDKIPYGRVEFIPGNNIVFQTFFGNSYSISLIDNKLLCKCNGKNRFIIEYLPGLVCGTFYDSKNILKKETKIKKQPSKILIDKLAESDSFNASKQKIIEFYLTEVIKELCGKRILSYDEFEIEESNTQIVVRTIFDEDKLCINIENNNIIGTKGNEKVFEIEIDEDYVFMEIYCQDKINGYIINPEDSMPFSFAYYEKDAHKNNIEAYEYFTSMTSINTKIKDKNYFEIYKPQNNNKIKSTIFKKRKLVSIKTSYDIVDLLDYLDEIYSILKNDNKKGVKLKK